MDEMTCEICGDVLDEDGYCDACCVYASELHSPAKGAISDNDDTDSQAGVDSASIGTDGRAVSAASSPDMPADATPSFAESGELAPSVSTCAVQETYCPECDMPGIPGTPCRQCGTTLPSSATHNAEAETFDMPPTTRCIQGERPVPETASPYADSAAQSPIVYAATAPARKASPYWAVPQPTLREARPVYVALPDGSNKLLEPGRPYLIGRESPDADITRVFARIPTVSRKHCEITVVSDGRELIIRDLGSTNGTFVNGAAVSAQRDTHAPVPVTIGLGENMRIAIG